MTMNPYASPPPTASPYTEPPAAPPTATRRGWWARNWKWFVPTGVVVLVGSVIGVLALLFACILGMLRGTEVYTTALTEARRDPSVAAALGVPIDEGGFPQGNIEMSPAAGYADLAIPIEGPTGSATILVVAEKSGGVWAYETLEVVVHDSRETIDLLEDW